MPRRRSPIPTSPRRAPTTSCAPCDEELQRLRRSWRESTDEDKRARLADRIQERAYQVVPYINGRQWKQFTAVRTTVTGFSETTVPVFWEVAKEG